MQVTHKQAELKYKNLRSIAYELTVERLTYQDRQAISLTEITDKAIAGINQHQGERAVDWDWRFGVRAYRRRYPNRFELAIWHNRNLCGLSLGRPTYRGTRMRLDFVEGSPVANPLRGRIAPITLTAHEFYARLVDATQVRIINPAAGLIDYYSSLGYMYVDGSGTTTNPNYMFKNLES